MEFVEDTSSVSIKGCCHLPLKGKAFGVLVLAFPFRGRCPVRGG